MDNQQQPLPHPSTDSESSRAAETEPTDKPMYPFLHKVGWNFDNEKYHLETRNFDRVTRLAVDTDISNGIMYDFRQCSAKFNLLDREFFEFLKCVLPETIVTTFLHHDDQHGPLCHILHRGQDAV